MNFKYLTNLNFGEPYWFLLLLLIPFLLAHFIFTHKKNEPSLLISNLSWLEKTKYFSFKERFHWLPLALRLITLALLIIVLARPQSSNSRKETNIQGIDIMMALDISGSMEAMDLNPSRLEAAKKVAKAFIKNRPNDRIGLVAFSGESFTQCPLTIDHKVLSSLFSPLKSGMIEDGTAIGDGMLTAINRIKDSEAKSKVIILLTDGMQNRGSVDPLSAAEVANIYGIRFYTIGVGREGMAPMPAMTPFGTKTVVNVPVEIDEDILKKVAQATDGKYYRATSNKKLQDIYNQIDKLERTRIDVSVFKNKYEEFYYFALAALLLFVLEILLRIVVFNSKP